MKEEGKWLKKGRDYKMKAQDFSKKTGEVRGLSERRLLQLSGLKSKESLKALSQGTSYLLYLLSTFLYLRIESES